jgi:molybdopterin-binding protein
MTVHYPYTGNGQPSKKKRARKMQISARNQLKGKIKAIKLGEVMAEVIIELGSGEELVSAITRGSVESLDLKVGDDAIAIIKSTEIIIGKP